jgi:hypothetical protein
MYGLLSVNNVQNWFNTWSTLSNIIIKGQKLDEVDTSKHLGSIISKDGSSTKEIKTRLQVASAATTKLKAKWKSNIILPVEIKYYIYYFILVHFSSGILSH